MSPSAPRYFQPLVTSRAPIDGPQAKLDDAEGTRRNAAAGVASAGQRLPHADRIQAAFGRHDVSQVRAHVGGETAEAAGGIGAEAYAAGSDVAFAAEPDLRLAAHEAAHVVQQRGGVSLSGGVGRAGDAYERHADEVAEAVAAGRSAEGLLDRVSGRGGASDVVSRVQLRPRRRFEQSEQGRRCVGGTDRITVPPTLPALRARLAGMVRWMTRSERSAGLVRANSQVASAWSDGLSDRVGQEIGVDATLQWGERRVDSVDFVFDIRNTTLDMEAELVVGRRRGHAPPQEADGGPIHGGDGPIGQPIGADPVGMAYVFDTAVVPTAQAIEALFTGDSQDTALEIAQVVAGAGKEAAQSESGSRRTSGMTGGLEAATDIAAEYVAGNLERAHCWPFVAEEARQAIEARRAEAEALHREAPDRPVYAVIVARRTRTVLPAGEPGPRAPAAAGVRLVSVRFSNEPRSFDWDRPRRVTSPGAEFREHDITRSIEVRFEDARQQGA